MGPFGTLLCLLAQAGPVGYYKGDDTPPAATDSSPNARNGTYTNGATTSATVPALLFTNATSMSFDGVDDFISVPTFPWPAGGPVTIAYWSFVPTGSEGFAKAEVTIGGTDTAGLSQKTLEAKKVPGLHFIGEGVDVTGWLGGYNFQWAWASGRAAGEAV